MTPLSRFEAFDAQLDALLSHSPSADADTAAHVYFAALADYWRLHKRSLLALRRSQLQAELDLRLHDKTLPLDAAALLRQCLQHPLPWQRRSLPIEQRVQLYRPSLQITRPNWRTTLPGTFILVAGSEAGPDAQPDHVPGPALLCSLSHGIEAFDSLASLHTEMCERLDDPVQSQALLRLCVREHDPEHARNAERLRYTWFSDDLIEAQVQALLDAQRARLVRAWQTEDDPLTGRTRSTRIAEAASLSPEAYSEAALRTRYALLLEAHSPSWLKNATPQALAHIVQTIQELVITIDRARAPGLLTHEQFLERHDLLEWTRARLREALRRDHQIDLAPETIYISVTMARRIGPIIHPTLPNAYVPVLSRPQAGDTIELVAERYSLDLLALMNLSWIDIDYWLTARVHHADGRSIDGLSPAAVKALVRALNVGDGYDRFIRTHLLESPTARWRQEACARIGQARMQLEAAKARYAGHFLADPLEQGYRWAKVVARYPDSRWRPTVEEHRLCVRQVLINGHTVQGVLLVTVETPQIQRFLTYAPDAPDRRPWREYRNVRELLRALRSSEKLQNYVIERVPLANHRRVLQLLQRGGLGPHVQQPEITGDFQQACYLAEVRAALAQADASSNTVKELLGELSLHLLWLTVDLISLVLPNRALSPLAFGRAAVSLLDGLGALDEQDRVGVLKHLVEAFTHMSDGVNSIGGSTVVRRAIRALPPSPPLSLPISYSVPLTPSRLRYNLEGIQGAGVYEKPSNYPGLALYYIQDNEQRFYQVSYDGYRWRAVDPRQPDAYTQVPVKRLENGSWVVDSPVLWYDGLPDLKALLDDCRLTDRPARATAEQIPGLHRDEEGLYLYAGTYTLPLRSHLLPDHYHLLIQGQPHSAGTAWAILRWQDGEWRLRVRQAGRSSAWLPLPPDYAVVTG